MPFDFDDVIPPDLFAKQRREDMLREAAQREEAEKRAAAESKARVDATTRRANESFLLAEYERSGVSPPIVGENGLPTVSLSMLLWQGWRIEQIGEERTLVRPAARAARPRKTRADYERENS